ncbi:MAG TPA: sugar phosphate isomerase/epimerase [Planctomycetota bacterium]|nr:sugar phosphate isomerase/epimerase [Planctomycetota bacterium]
MKYAFSKPAKDEADRRLIFERCRACGYDGLQLKGNDYQPFLDRPVGLLETWPQLRGGVSGLILGAALDDAGIARIRKTFAVAREASADLVILCDSSGRSASTNLKRTAALLSELGAEAKRLGTKLSLHHHHNHPVMTRDEMRTFFKAVKPGTVGLTIDTAHLIKSGIDDVAGVIREFAGVVDNFHIKDYANGEFVPLGTGVLDLKAVASAIRDIGYHGWLCADEESGQDSERSMRTCLEAMRNS